MISKETFCKALQMIQEQSETDAEFSRALDLVGDGYFIFGVKNKYFEALLLVLKEAMNDKYDYTGLQSLNRGYEKRMVLKRTGGPIELHPTC